MTHKEIAETLYNFLLHEYVEKKIGNETTYDSQLTSFCNSLFGSKFVGVFPSDKIPKFKNKKCCILNLDNSQQSGSHWVAYVHLNNNNYLFYDSFGRIDTSIIKSLSRKGIKNINTELDQEQDLKEIENNCGQRCISFLLCHFILDYEFSKFI